MKKTIKLQNGSTAVDFTAEDSKLKAIVHLATLQRITSYMPREETRVIIRDIIEKLSDNENNLEACVNIMSDEVNFHQTVNLIDTWKPEEFTAAEKAGLAGIDLGITAAKEAVNGKPEMIDDL